MKRAVCLLIAAILADRVIGSSLDVLYRRCLAGENGGLINFAIRQNADVLILGSSRARHHIVPSILSRKLGLKAFNAGMDGQDFLYAMMLFHTWVSARGDPKIVLLEIDPLSFEQSSEELERASVFSPFAGRDLDVRRILLLRGPFERIKLLSHAYRYNGKVLPIFKNLFVRPAPAFDGYVGLDPALHSDGGPQPVEGSIRLPDLQTPFWDIKVAMFDELLAYCNRHGTRLFLVHSPHYGNDPVLERRWKAELHLLLAKRPDAALIDCDILFASRFTGRTDLFHDPLHLNDRGANTFSALLADELARRLATLRVSDRKPKDRSLSPMAVRLADEK